VHDPKIYPFKILLLLAPAFIFCFLSTFLALTLYGSSDPAAAKVGAIFLPIDLLLLAFLVIAALSQKPYLSVAEQGLVVRLPFRTRTYSWSDIHEVSFEESARQPVIKLQLRSGATTVIPSSLMDPVGAYTSIQKRHEGARPVA
jgi:hypothetical protein